jgi:alanyl-tRNA synthetase
MPLEPSRSKLACTTSGKVQNAGVPEERIKRMGADDNFWASGATGPCGPCSELYYDLHPERGMHADIDLGDDSRFIEFYNLVFMELNRDASGQLTPLANKNIDTGMGLERVAQILQRVPNNYETDLIKPIMDVAARLAGALLSQSTVAVCLSVVASSTCMQY